MDGKKVFITIMAMAMLLAPVFPSSGEENDATTIILVRHAEEDRGKEQIPLTDMGHLRAKDLAWVLQNVKIDAVFSTNTVRTKSTARPMAEIKGITPGVYYYKDYGDLQPFIDSIVKNYRGKTVLISGHSDDVPIMISMIKKEEGTFASTQVIHKAIYDNLFIAFVPANGKAVVLNLKYGQPSQPR